MSNTQQSESDSKEQTAIESTTTTRATEEVYLPRDNTPKKKKG